MTAAIQHLYDRLKAHYPHAELELGGIYANKPGYHNKRDNLPPHDYSVQLPDDRAGSGQNASALDITLRDPADMTKLTQRLIDLTFARDPAIQVLREFLGTLNGYDVTGMDVREVRYIGSSDDTHTWHEHLSVYRRYADDWAAMDALADAIIGSTPAPVPEPNLKELDMFIMWNDQGATLIAPGYQKILTGDEVTALQKIPGMVNHKPDSQYEFDCIGGATFNGKTTPPPQD